MPSAMELMQDIDDDLRHAVESGIAPPSYGIFREWCISESKKVHAALAEMENDRPFIEAADRYMLWREDDVASASNHDDMARDLLAAYRKRREARGKDD